ncbi:MAG: glycosyltransferase [Xanthomonadales bacterium]|nr:glycosyltransferase [Xanthomonadales bacterium]
MLLTLTQKIFRPLLPGCARLENQYDPQEIPSPAPLSVESGGIDYPRISIIVPSYSQGHFIRNTLDSIINQNYPNLELIVVDGGSEDGTVEVIKEYSEHIKWWVSEDDNGQASAINKGMEHATGDILAWLNSDDCLMPGALLKVASCFLASSKTDVVYGHRVLINAAGMDIGKWIMPGHHHFLLTYADYIPQETMFWRSALWQKTGAKIDESFHFALDWELIRRFIKADAKFQLIPVFLGQFRLHDLQKTQANIESDGFREMEIIRNNCKQEFSNHIAMQNFYYRAQRVSLYYFLLKARLKELLWRMKFIRIN